MEPSLKTFLLCTGIISLLVFVSVLESYLLEGEKDSYVIIVLIVTFVSTQESRCLGSTPV